MELTREFQLKYQGESGTETVAKRNLRDYFIIITKLPEDIQKGISDIHKDSDIGGMLTVGNYSYNAGYEGLIRQVNTYLGKHRSELSQDNGIHDEIDRALHADYAKVANWTNSLDFLSTIHRLLEKDQGQSAIYHLIERHGLYQIDKYLQDELMFRDDYLQYGYSGTDADDRILDNHHAEIEEVAYRSEFGRFPVLPKDDIDQRSKDSYTERMLYLWSQDDQGHVTRILAEDYGDIWDVTLTDLCYQTKQGLVHNLQDHIQQANEELRTSSIQDDPNDVFDSSLGDYVDQLKAVARESTVIDRGELWYVGDGVLKARPLDDEDIFTLVQELQARKAEEKEEE